MMDCTFRVTAHLLILTTALVSVHAESQTPAGLDTELTFFGGYGFGGNFRTESGLDIDLDDGNDFGFIVDFANDEETQWEFLYLQQNASADTSQLSELEPSIDTNIRLFHGGGTYRGGEARVRPFVAGTAGLTRIEPHGNNTDSDTYWSISFGGGVQIRATERIGFRLEGRILATLINTDSAIYCGSNLSSGQCLFILESNVLWQSHAYAGITVRF